MIRLPIKKYRRSSEQHFLFGVFCAIILVGVVAAFYRSAFRSRVEDKLFDVRTRLLYTSSILPDVATVSITAASIELLMGKPSADLGYKGLELLVHEILRAQPKAVFINLFPQIFPYSDPALQALVTRFSDAPVYYGLLGITDLSAATAALPPFLQPVMNRVFYGDTLLEYRRAVLRSLPVIQPLKESIPLFLPFVAKTFRPEVLSHLELVSSTFIKHDDVSYGHVRLNFNGLATIPEVLAENIATQQPDALAQLHHRIVTVGYRPFRNWSTQPTLVNGPWQIDGGDLKEGNPLQQVQAIGIQNVLNRSYLHPLPLIFNVLQTVFVAAFSLLIWRMRSGYAAMAFVLMWTGLLIMHGLLFSVGSIFLELSDTALFSSIGLITGSLWRLREEGRLRAVEEARAESNRQVAYLQSQYLDDLAFELNAVNDSIALTLQPIRSSQDSDVQRVFGQALASTEELREYLIGIEQLADIDAKILQKVVRRRIRIEPILQRIAQRFDFRMREEGIELHSECPPNIFVMADEMLLEQVIYSIFSNAVKYSPRGSIISVAVRTEKKQVIVAVKDQGPGIPLEFQENIFEKFYRVKNEFIFKTKGHGLGLYLSRYFASSMGATISVKSSPDMGAMKSSPDIGAMKSSPDMGAMKSGPTQGSIFEISLSRARA